ncbi:SigE family RNA polymerase sigma factor [Thermoactinospora rubra]|uniref:SigE family RNA polymerase sigma factor n=1 Tax=Thermoactinospora rubra TaxID=1088767 RepID=UPI000A11E51A|nr:SigE family RNA polymerase sigma factor [Thermoactinospora rubra]
MAHDRAAQEEFRLFFERHHREMSRLAYLLTGDHDLADDLAADAFTAAWSRWDRVRACPSAQAYVRGIVVNLVSNRLRKVIRERAKLLKLEVADRAHDPDVPAVVDVRSALRRLPVRKRACVVLRYAFDLSEEETAAALGISVGTVKSQTSKASAELAAMLRSLRREPVAEGRRR